MTGSETRTNSRAALIDAAFDEFTTKGYEAATVAGIADRAGVTTGAVYAHFTGKLDLLLATVGLTPIADIARSVDGLGTVGHRTMADQLARGLAERPDLRRLLLLDVIVVARREPRVAEVLRSGLEAYVAATARALGTTEALPRLLAVLNLGMVVFAALDTRTPPAEAFAGLVASLLPVPKSDSEPDPDPTPDSASLEWVRALAAEAARAEVNLHEAVTSAIAEGHSLRRVGAAAGRSHEAVRRIAKRAEMRG